jgi:uncharacterized oligopeptide transporter (OPT) family protein
MKKQSLIKALQVAAAVGYLAGAAGSTITPVYGDDRACALLVAVPAVLQGIESAVRWAARTRTGQDRGDDHPAPER